MIVCLEKKVYLRTHFIMYYGMSSIRHEDKHIL